MKALSKMTIAAPIAFTLLSACVSTQYRVESTNYTNRDEAWAAVMRSDMEIEAGIPAGSVPLAQKKLLIVIPTSVAFMKFGEADAKAKDMAFPAPGTPKHGQLTFEADSMSQNLKSIAASIKKANIYSEVVIFDSTSTSENIQPNTSQDVLIPTYVVGAGSTWYFLSQKNGKQILEVDYAQKDRLDRRKSILNALKAKALQQ